MKYKYTKEEFELAVASSTSIRQTLNKLKVASKGGNYSVFHRFAKKFNVDTSHFKGPGWNKGFKFGPKRNLEDILNNKYPLGSSKLKKRLLKENVLPYQCNSCKLSFWLNSKIPLELHHKNGINKDNSLQNLELLCPNCHALTD